MTRLLPVEVETCVRAFNAVAALVVGAVLLALTVYVVRRSKRTGEPGFTSNELLFLQGVGWVLLAASYGSAEALWMPEVGARVLILAIGLVWIGIAITAAAREQWKRRH